MGRKPKPRALKILDGTMRKDREDTHILEVAFPPVKPANRKPPAWLGAVAKKKYAELIKALDKVDGLLSAVDGDALAQYSALHQEVIEATAAITQHGILVESPHGAMMPNPAVQMRSKAIVGMNRIAASFGLTPVSRAGIKLPESKKVANDAFGDLLKMRG